jgi:hypothetical protein
MGMRSLFSWTSKPELQEGGEGSQNNSRFSNSPMQLTFPVYITIETNLHSRFPGVQAEQQFMLQEPG